MAYCACDVSLYGVRTAVHRTPRILFQIIVAQPTLRPYDYILFRA